MSGNAFIGDQVLVDASFDAARCQLRRLASDGVLPGASKYAYRAGITGLIQAAGPAAALPPLAGVEPGDLAERLGVPGCGCAGTRPVPTAPCSRL
jgi:hypothetical protein